MGPVLVWCPLDTAKGAGRKGWPWDAASGKVGPNAWAGIRTKATRKNDKTWLAAHVAAYPLMRDTALANATLLIISLFLPSEFQAYLVQVATGALLAGVIFAGVQGQKAAKAADV